MKRALSMMVALSLMSVSAFANPTQVQTARRPALPTVKPVQKAKPIVHPVLLKTQDKRRKRASQVKRPSKQLDLSAAFKRGS